MGAIRWKTKRLIWLCLFLSIIFMIYLTLLRGHKKPLSSLFFAERLPFECSTNLLYHKPRPPKQSPMLPHDPNKPNPVVGILAAPGSGEMWLRKILEQLTGFYTGSIAVNSSHVHFEGDGEKSKAILVLGHDVEPMPPMTSAVILYRDMKDTVRTHYVQQQDAYNFNHSPPHTFYGSKWLEFVNREGKLWSQRYNSYLDIAIPVLVVHYKALLDPVQLQGNLLRIANHLHVPVKQSVLNCLVQNAQLSPLMPKPLPVAAKPFDLVQRIDLIKMEQAELRVIARLEDAHQKFKPRA